MTGQPEALDLRAQDIAEDKRRELLRLFPEIRTGGGKLDFERLKLVEGRVELLWYVQEQCISFDYHRYGNLGPRSGEERAAVL